MRKPVAMIRAVAFAVLAASSALSAGMVSSPLCERLTIQELWPGMGYDQVRLKMGGGGIQSVTRNLDRQETSVADYPGPALDVYVEYDHRLNRRPPAHAVLVRASMPWSAALVHDLVNRFGAPDAGADYLSNGLVEGVAVWVNETCGVVLTAYRPRDTWWAAEGRTTLQLETLELARKGNSPASSSLSAILDRQHGVPAAASVAAAPPAVAQTPPPATGLEAEPIKANDAPPVTIPSTRNESHEAPSVTTDPPPVSAAAPKTTESSHAHAPVRSVPATPSDRPAERITFVPPVYPRTGRWLGSKGHVTLAIVVKANGKVAGSPRVLAVDPPNQGFAESAIAAVHTWRFSPALRAGKPVKSTLTIDVAFE